jgi:hypothetical protein
MEFVDMIEKKRTAAMKKMEKANIGTFKGLKDMLKKKQLGALQGSQPLPDKPEEEQSDAK